MRIAEGGFSFGYLGMMAPSTFPLAPSLTDATTQNGSREVALKLYHFKDKNELKFPIHEARVLADINGIVLEDINGNVLDDINGNKGIPTIYWSGRKCEYHVIAQELLEWSWADDLESLGYVLLRFYGGKLNWIINCKHNNCDVLQSPWRCKLQRPSVREMCKGLPKEFFEYFRHIRSLEHGQKPDYDHLRELFRCASRNRGYQYDNIYDWTSKWFNEVHSIKSTPKEQSELVEKQITTSLTPHELASAGGSIEMQL
ncbi:Casein kinase I hhp2 [Beauveria bassiana]|nr:Casein kinase I hhp2 [Beauveria bassiana]